MKIISIVLLVIGSLFGLLIPQTLGMGLFATPWICFGFSGLAYLFYRIQNIESKLK